MSIMPKSSRFALCIIPEQQLRIAADGSTPLAMRSSPRGPYSTIVDACVQTAPTPARTCGTARPTNGTRVVTAAPDCPVAGIDRAQRER